jgi:hypothetical protein
MAFIMTFGVLVMTFVHAISGSAAAHDWQPAGNAGCQSLASKYPDQVFFSNSSVYANETSSKNP